MKTGASSNHQQVSHDPYLSNKKHDEGRYDSNTPSRHYNNDVKTPIGHSSNEHGYISHPPAGYRPHRHHDDDVKTPTYHEHPEIHEPQPEYQSPYDSAAKNHYSGNDVYEDQGKPYAVNDAYSPSVHDIPIPDERDTYSHNPSKDHYASEPYPNEYANAPIAQEYVNPHISHGSVDSPISQEYVNPSVSQEHSNSHVSQEYIKSPDSHEYANHGPKEPIYQPVSQEPINHHIAQEPLSPPLSQEYIPSPPEPLTPVVSQEHVEPVLVHEPIYTPVSQEQVNTHIPESYAKSPVPQEYANLPVSKKNEVPQVHHAEAALVPVEYPNSPIEQQHIHPQVSQDYIDTPVVSQKTVIPSIKTVPSKPILEPEPVEQVSVPVYDEPNKADYSAGPKYQFVPSGPAYVTNSHSAEIIHPPLPDSHNSGPYEIPVDDSSSVAEFKPASVSHAFRLPISAPSGPHVDNVEPEDHIEDSLPTAPISHSTRLLIPSSGPAPDDYVRDSHPPVSHSARLHVPISGPEDYAGENSPVAPISHSTRLDIPNSYPSEETDLESLLPKSQLDVKSPGSFQNIGGSDLPPFAPFPQPVADFKSLQLEAESAGNAPEPVEVDYSGPSNDDHVQPPISHAFRLSVPSAGSIPSLNLPPNPNHGANPVEEKVSASLNAPHTPLSHAFRLSLPPQDYPQDHSAGDIPKSYDSAFVESKPKSIKA